MGAQLNIKDAETIRLARELSNELGISVTATIREALEEKARRREAEREELITKIMEISHEFRAAMPADWHGKTSKEIMDEIYDEHGLPK
ncbi:type II toxin-antitoxin system VapB family antitoxin [Sphingomonas sp. HITSZ_GF]|uniref:type II toxin-antitoxin system VapB family antitoxin n=1 Tax=Sphingomonas sp. HITSZ_GF TaxID=3037247 RepID=UPI00240D2A37|nr:type II toxin-antitoxin system VapB family antitoxin [Sphingomonas sp. HITSZ_GF]MDG2533823.1 type II toxin-antitoxin system VapB family antitoxin [Sphingomonas sp. HITSZ_GF]